MRSIHYNIIIASCIFTKIVSVVLMLVASALPFYIFFINWDWRLLWGEFFILLISYSLIKISYQILLSTNNPADRKNIFSINRRYSSKMNGSINDNGLNAITLLEPTNEEILHINKNKRLKKLKKLHKICQI
jgi:hypothetical protein